jgi:hypothetical protein
VLYAYIIGIQLSLGFVKAGLNYIERGPLACRPVHSFGSGVQIRVFLTGLPQKAGFE